MGSDEALYYVVDDGQDSESRQLKSAGEFQANGSIQHKERAICKFDQRGFRSGTMFDFGEEIADMQCLSFQTRLRSPQVLEMAEVDVDDGS